MANELLEKSRNIINSQGKVASLQANFEFSQGTNKGSEVFKGVISINGSNIKIENISDRWTAEISGDKLTTADLLPQREAGNYEFEPIETSFGEMTVNKFLPYPLKNETVDLKSLKEKALEYKNSKDFDEDKYNQMAAPLFFAEKITKLAGQPVSISDVGYYLKAENPKLLKAGNPTGGTPYIIEEKNESETKKISLDPKSFLPVKIVTSDNDDKGSSTTISITYEKISGKWIITRYAEEEIIAYSHSKRFKNISFSSISIN